MSVYLYEEKGGARERERKREKIGEQDSGDSSFSDKARINEATGDSFPRVPRLHASHSQNTSSNQYLPTSSQFMGVEII